MCTKSKLLLYLPPEICLFFYFRINIMNRTLSALCFINAIVLIVFEVAGNSVFFQQKPISVFEGEWEFERAEYLERDSPVSNFQVKYEIKSADGLEGLPGCLNQTVKFISIRDIVQVECPYDTYYGRGGIVTHTGPQGDSHLLLIGCNSDELGKESPIEGLFFNVLSLNYRIEMIDDKTIAITKEAVCDVNSVETHCAVRSILKK